MTLRLLAILDIRKHWNWYLRVTGGLRYLNMLVNMLVSKLQIIVDLVLFLFGVK